MLFCWAPFVCPPGGAAVLLLRLLSRSLLRRFCVASGEACLKEGKSYTPSEQIYVINVEEAERKIEIPGLNL